MKKQAECYVCQEQIATAWRPVIVCECQKQADAWISRGPVDELGIPMRDYVVVRYLRTTERGPH